tara:strand:- start:8131 stop:9021 length:891 start_codon:yes stop_codon:yes gene_type:complete
VLATSIFEKLEIPYTQGLNGYISISCPFKDRHKNGDKNPSFILWPERDYARCYGCGLRFDSILTLLGAIGKERGIDLNLEALEFYIPPISTKLVETVENVKLNEEILDLAFKKNTQQTNSYLKGRGVIQSNLPFPVYEDPRNARLVTAIRSDTGDLVGATGRSLRSKGHYHYFGVVTGSCLLGHERNESDRILVVEGMTDLLNVYSKMSELEILNKYDVYATLTCNLTSWQKNALVDLDKPITLGWDMDKAGKMARKKYLDLLTEEAIAVKDLYWKDENLDMGNMSKLQLDFLLTK